MPAKVMTFHRSAPAPHAVPPDPRPSADHRPSTSSKSGNNSNNYHNNSHNHNSFHAPRQNGRFGNQYANRYGNHDGEMSAARHLQQQISQGHQAHSPRHARSSGGVAVFTASGAGVGQAQQQRDNQEISESATIIWAEGGIGEVMSPSVWRHSSLHLYFDATRTRMEGDGGWEGLRQELEPGMEIDIHFSLSNGRLLQLQQAAAAASGGGAAAETHVFICLESVAEPRVSRSATIRTCEQAIVIAKRGGPAGAAFLINNSGERTVLHPNFLPLDAVRHAILEKTEGPKVLEHAELDSPSSLCVLGRSLSVRLAPAPPWLPTIYPTDRGVTRWALAAEPYGEEKEGRAVVVKSSCHSVSLCAVEGELARRRTTLHAPIIQMVGEIKKEVQQRGSTWRFRACRELPGRTAVWRAFEIAPELESDEPIPSSIIESILRGEGTGAELMEEGEEEREEDRRRRRQHQQLLPEEEEQRVERLIDAGEEEVDEEGREEEERRERESQRNRLAELEQVFAPVLVFDSIDDVLDSETFEADVFKAPCILHNEWRLLGVPPHEAITTESELAALPSHPPIPRRFGVFETGDERPDMRVQPKMKKRKRRRNEDAVEIDEAAVPEEEKREDSTSAAAAAAVGESQPQREEKRDEDKSARERKKEQKEDARMKQQLESSNVGFVAAGEDLFDLLHGSGSTGGEAAPTAAAAPAAVADAAAAPAAKVEQSAAAAAQDFQPPPLFARCPEAEKRERAAAAAVDAAREASSRPAAAAPIRAPPITMPDRCGAVLNPRVRVIVQQRLPRPPAPRVQILPYPERPRHDGGWWFRPTRPRPPPVESRKKKKRWEEKRKEEEEGSSEDTEEEERRARSPAHSPDSAPADPAPTAEKKKPAFVATPFEPPVRKPVDDLRARLLGKLKNPQPAAVKPVVQLVQQPQQQLQVETREKKKKEEDKGVEAAPLMENVLVDLSPISTPSPAAAASAADSAPSSTPSPTLASPTIMVHNDLMGLF